MKKKLLAYILLTAGAVILLLQIPNRSPFGKKNTSFAVENAEEITGIDLIEGRKRVELRRREGSWRVNNDSEARESAVRFLVKTLAEIRIKSPVSPELFRNEIIEKKIEPVRVVVFRRNRTIKSFYIYKTGSNIYGNIMRMRPSSNPFIVYMPGYENNIGSHFVVNELFWQPFTAFRVLPSEIRSVEFVNFNEPESSFIIRNESQGFRLYDNSRLLAGWDTSRVKRYIAYFAAVSFESREFNLSGEEKEEILLQPVLFRITVTRNDGSLSVLTIRERWKTTNGERVKDTDRVWADMEDGRGLAVMRYFDLDPLLKKRSYFFGG